MTKSQENVPTVILYGGSEVPEPQKISALLDLPITSTGRELEDLLRDVETATVVPMSTGRDLTSITQAAQTLRWFRDGHPEVSVCISGPVVNDTYTIAQYRKHIRDLASQVDGVIFLSQAVDPFADAELVRRLRLAQHYSEQVAVEVAFEGTWPALESTRDRFVHLGCTSVAVVRADFGVAGEGQRALFSSGALRTAVRLAADTAEHMLHHGNDGIAAALLADHDQGFAHSHGDEEHGHSHAHVYTHHH
ncbi:MAG TPA: hypothetical protein H9867_08045 [Candidatus Corynebacterium gallistercoris]|uniref:Cobalamin biosynthesis protein CbiX n=1 Tax=Candidatus Corynebacterium gallistercoris TaxID=2838530 RepID=A0A9D1RXN4_9CORY|nr:hypothetical protein [Candidatus Corynebacterium gallistercoris]